MRMNINITQGNNSCDALMGTSFEDYLLYPVRKRGNFAKEAIKDV